MAEEPKLSELMTMREAARYCDRSHGRVRSYVQSGKLRAWKLGKLWVTTKKEVDRPGNSFNPLDSLLYFAGTIV